MRSFPLESVSSLSKRSMVDPTPKSPDTISGALLMRGTGGAAVAVGAAVTDNAYTTRATRRELERARNIVYNVRELGVRHVRLETDQIRGLEGRDDRRDLEWILETKLKKCCITALAFIAHYGLKITRLSIT